MKKMYKYLLGTIAFLFLIIACNKEISDDLVVFYTVEFNETTIESLLNTAEATDFKIVVQGAIEAGDYQIKYDVTQGSGYYVINSENISEGQFIDLPAGPEFSISYVSTTAGVNNVTLTLRDEKGREKDFAVIYNVSDTAFTFDISPEPNFTYIDGVSNLNMAITEISSASYDISYAFGDDNTGTITIEGEDVAQGEKQTITEAGNFVWQFTGATIGTVDLIFTIESSLGVILEETISIEVTETPDFLFSAVLTNDMSITVGSEAGINFNIEETFPSTYTMKYTTTNAGSLSYGGQVYQVGDDIVISTGSSVGVYTGTISGEHNLIFTVSNANLEPVILTEEVIIDYREVSGAAPTIELEGDGIVNVVYGESFVDPGVIITDDVDTDLEATISGEVNVNAIGEYTLVYSVTDSSNNTATVSRIVNVVVNSQVPVVELTGDNPQIIQLNESYDELGATTDTGYSLAINTADLNISTPGEYEVLYIASDASGQPIVTLERTVIVNNPPTADFTVSSISGDAPLDVTFNNAMSNDSDGSIIKSEWDFDNGESDVDTSFPSMPAITYSIAGTYTVTLTVTDNNQGVATVTKTITVTQGPIVTGFNRATGLLTASAGSVILVAMQSGGNGISGNAFISAGSIASGTTCWGGAPCLISIHDTDPADDSMEFTFIMPASNEVVFTGSHNANTTGNSQSQFVIQVDGQGVYNDFMSNTEGIPSN